MSLLNPFLFLTAKNKGFINKVYNNFLKVEKWEKPS